MKARYARPEPLNFLEQSWRPFLKILIAEFSSIRRRPLDHIREADSEPEQFSIVFRKQFSHAKAEPRTLAQFRSRKCRPEAAGGARKIMSAFNGIQPRIDPDENQIKPRPKVIGKCLERILSGRLQHNDDISAQET
jgi:hypothetical protein